MTQRQFDDTIRKLLDEALDRETERLKRLQQIRNGTRDVTRVRVREHTVPEHVVKSHWRLVPGRLAKEAA